MKDNRRCFMCGRGAQLRKNRGMCSQCINLVTIYKNKIRSCMYAAIKHNTRSYIWKYLSYTLGELKQHLESQFEPWMTWNNYGRYNSKIWNDDDSSTWTWNVDHIIPHANFIFTSVDDINFTECWSLDNLRPYSSKKNILKNIKENYET